MARKLRIEYSGAIYHVMNRGDRREPIFADDADRRRFLETLGETCQKTGWQIHAYCLMPNHLHLVLETPQPNLVVGMKWLLGRRKHLVTSPWRGGGARCRPTESPGLAQILSGCCRRAKGLV